MKRFYPFVFLLLLNTSCTGDEPIPKETIRSEPYITVLGTAQDAGYPQAGCEKEQCRRYWDGKEDKRYVVSLGLTDPLTGQNWLFEATPDFPRQLRHLQRTSGHQDLSGIFLTHAHIGHYTGLMYTGHEAMGASSLPVYVMPQMKSYLENNGPWQQLVSMENIDLKLLQADSSLYVSSRLKVSPFLVPHRDEFSETVGYRIESSGYKVLFIPDINKWEVWEEDIVSLISEADLAFLDATFYDRHELPGRDMSEIPHPYVEESLSLFEPLPRSEKNKIVFIHFNHTNPLILNSPERRQLESSGYKVASAGMHFTLN